MAVACTKQHELVGGDMVWYKEWWEQGTVLENKRGKLVWDFEFDLYKTTTARKPYLTFEDKAKKKNGFAPWHALHNEPLSLKG